MPAALSISATAGWRIEHENRTVDFRGIGKPIRQQDAYFAYHAGDYYRCGSGSCYAGYWNRRPKCD